LIIDNSRLGKIEIEIKKKTAIKNSVEVTLDVRGGK
jgi:hypothetical protein